MITCEERNDGAAENGEEAIKVAIRMRPLNSRETTSESLSSSTGSRVWRVLQKHNSVMQTTNSGKPLPERVNGRTFFTFDKTFGEDVTTKQVYDNIARGIVKSVVIGLNGTIFAYGQTSSGKTYTMQGSGSIEDGFGNGGGIVHMAARDIFSHISNEPDRVFLIRVSFIEIYNEEVRDLLVSGNVDNVLAIREDPHRGVFVNSNENIVTDLQALLDTLFAGRKNMSVASTGMNERSSRSHTIFKITVESRKRLGNGSENDSESENEGSFQEKSSDEDDGAVRISTLNLVDIAGSENVRQTGSTGERQKEGGQINRSLLTLSRVIAALGSSSASHINFRDSKLTRILQPSLSGNARMAVICCATPSELYLEETRSTLQFASRAKLVKTRAQINEVLDDRSLIKKLQRELSEARRAAGGKDAISRLRSLAAEIANAELNAREAEETIKRLKKLILEEGILFGENMQTKENVSSSQQDKFDSPSLLTYNNSYCKTFSLDLVSPSQIKFSSDRTKRQRSDGISLHKPLQDITNIQNNSFLKLHGKTMLSNDTSVIKHSKRLKNKVLETVPSHAPEASLLREALIEKSELVQSLEKKLAESQVATEEYSKGLSSSTDELMSLKKSKEQTESFVTKLLSDKEVLEKNKKRLIAEYEEHLNEKNKTINEALLRIDTILAEKNKFEQKINLLTKENKDLTKTKKSLEKSLSDTMLEKNQGDNKIKEMKSKLNKLMVEKAHALETIDRLEMEKNKSNIRVQNDFGRSKIFTDEMLIDTACSRERIFPGKKIMFESTGFSLDSSFVSDELSKVHLNNLQRNEILNGGANLKNLNIFFNSVEFTKENIYLKKPIQIVHDIVFQPENGIRKGAEIELNLNSGMRSSIESTNRNSVVKYDNHAKNGQFHSIVPQMSRKTEKLSRPYLKLDYGTNIVLTTATRFENVTGEEAKTPEPYGEDFDLFLRGIQVQRRIRLYNSIDFPGENFNTLERSSLHEINNLKGTSSARSQANNRWNNPNENALYLDQNINSLMAKTISINPEQEIALSDSCPVKITKQDLRSLQTPVASAYSSQCNANSVQKQMFRNKHINDEMPMKCEDRERIRHGSHDQRMDKVRKRKRCSCSNSVLFSEDAHHANFFLPKLACNCGAKEENVLQRDNNCLQLSSILRQWQVDFLGTMGIISAQDLLRVHNKNPKRLAKALKYWTNIKEGVEVVSTKSCIIALYIWTRTASSAIKAVNRQLLDANIIRRPSFIEITCAKGICGGPAYSNSNHSNISSNTRQVQGMKPII